MSGEILIKQMRFGVSANNSMNIVIYDVGGFQDSIVLTPEESKLLRGWLKEAEDCLKNMDE